MSVRYSSWETYFSYEIAKLPCRNVQCNEIAQLMSDLVAKIDKLHVGIYSPKCNI